MEPEDPGEKDDSLIEFVRGCSKFLKKKEEILSTLPERFETLLLRMESHSQKAPEETCNFSEFRGDEQRVLEKRKQADLVKRYKDEIKEKDERIAQLENELKQLKERKEEDVESARFKKMQDQCIAALSKKDEELESLKRRLAELHEKNVKMDQRKVEDTCAANRPSEVNAAFSDFFVHGRMDAIEKVQEEYGSEEVTDVDFSYKRLASMIFEAAYEQTREVKQAVLEVFQLMVKEMVETAPQIGQKFATAKTNGQLPCDIPFYAVACSQEFSYPTDVMDAIVLSLKETAHVCSLESLEKGIMKKIEEKWFLWPQKDQSCKFSLSESLLSKLRDYIMDCIRLSWRMVTQVPPMQLEYQRSRQPLSGQESAEDVENVCFIWPALLDGGGKLIQAAEVLTLV